MKQYYNTLSACFRKACHLLFFIVSPRCSLHFPYIFSICINLSIATPPTTFI